MKRRMPYICAVMLMAGCASAPKTALSPVHEEAISHNWRGNELSVAGKLDKALAEFKHSLTLSRSIDDTRGIIISQLNIARVCLILESPEEADKAIKEAVQRSESFGDKDLLAAAYATLAKYLYSIGDNSKAGEYIKRALEIDRKEGHKDLGERLNILGLLLIRDGKLKEADEALKEALKTNLYNGNKIEVANSHRGIGTLLAAKGQIKDAVDAFEKALELDKRAGDGRKIASDFLMIGEMHLRDLTPRRALPNFIRAYEVSLNFGRRDSLIQLLNRIINVSEESGEKDLAIFYADERIKLER